MRNSHGLGRPGACGAPRAPSAARPLSARRARARALVPGSARPGGRDLARPAHGYQPEARLRTAAPPHGLPARVGFDHQRNAGGEAAPLTHQFAASDSVAQLLDAGFWAVTGSVLMRGTGQPPAGTWPAAARGR